jgi:hypothetical protein
MNVSTWRSDARSPRDALELTQELPSSFSAFRYKTKINPYVKSVGECPTHTDNPNVKSDGWGVSVSDAADCHPEEAESSAKRAAPDEGPMQFAGGIDAAGQLHGPFDKLRAGSSARKVRGPQDDKGPGRRNYELGITTIWAKRCSHSYSPPNFFSGRKYAAGISAKMKNEA